MQKVNVPLSPTALETDQPSNKPRTLDRTLSILEQALRSSSTPSAAAITDALNLPRPTVNRMISQLIQLGLLRRDPLSRTLVPDRRMVELALNTLMRCTEHDAIHLILEEVASSTNETCNLGTIHEGHVHYLSRVESRWPLAFRINPEGRVPLHCSAQGKLLLSTLPEPIRDRYLEAIQYTAYTSNSIVCIEKMRKEIATIQQAGYAFDNEEFLEGLIGIAVLVPLENNNAPIGLAVAAPSARASFSLLKGYLPLLRDAAEKIAFVLKQET